MSLQIRKLIDDIRQKEPVQYRAATLARSKTADGKDSEDTFSLSFSSEDPYERYFGVEILGHKSTEVRMDWIKSGSAPLLLEHNRSEQIGIVEKATLENGRGTAVVRFGKTGRAKEILDDVTAGIRKNVSVGYEVLDMVLLKQGKDGESSTYRVTDWRPLEISIVSLPADTTVGVGRGRESSTPITPPKEYSMTPDEIAAGQKAASDTASKNALTNERERIKSIRALGAKNNQADLAAKACEDGTDLATFKDQLLDAIAAKSAGQGPAQSTGVHPGAALGGHSRQDQRDLRRYSFRKAIAGLANGVGLEGIEKEMHEEGTRQANAIGMETKGLSIPSQILNRADLTVAADGTNLVATDVMGDWIGALRNKMVLAKLGARFLTGLRGNVSFPKLSAGSAATWEGENDAGAESEPTTSKLSMSPKRVGLYAEISKQLLLQSTPDVEFMIRDDLATAIALAIDSAGISGPGSGGAPTGITATSGIGSVAGGTNGLAPTFAHLVGLETQVAIDNADLGKLSYLTNSAVRGKLKGTAKVASTDSRMIWDTDGLLNGYGVGVTNAVPSNLTKGSASAICSAIIFGNFDDLIIGQWGGLDLVVDPYTLATTGIVRVVANAYADVGVRNAESFSAMLDALTT